MRPSTAILLVFTLLASSACSNKTTPLKPARPTPKTEFSATITGFQGGDYKADVSTKKDRFRFLTDDRIFLGTLQAEGDILVLDPSSKRYLRVQRGRRSGLFKSHNRIAANRYESAKIGSYAEGRRQILLAPFKSPCEAAVLTPRYHQECEVVSQGEGLEVWTHKGKFSGFSIPGGSRSTEMESELSFNTKFGVIVGGNKVCYRDLEAKSFPEDHFELPAGYQEALTDEELRDTRFQEIGEPGMLAGYTLDGFVHSTVDYPTPPGPLTSFYQKETWSTADDKLKFYIERRAFFEPVDPDQILGKLDHRIQVEQWDDTAEFGQRSFRESERTLVFFINDQLFKVTAPKKHTALVAELCRFLVGKFGDGDL